MSKETQTPTPEKELEQFDKVAELVALVKEQGEKIALLEAEVEALKAAEPSNVPVRKANAPKEPPSETFSVGGKKYRFNSVKYRQPIGGIMYAKDALKDPAELERLVLVKSGVIDPVK